VAPRHAQTEPSSDVDLLELTPGSSSRNRGWLAAGMALSLTAVVGAAFVTRASWLGAISGPAAVENTRAAFVPSLAALERNLHEASPDDVAQLIEELQPLAAKRDADAAAVSALLHAHLATLELERARLLVATGDAGPRAEGAESASEGHRIAAYQRASTARSYGGERALSHLAMASYQGLRGARTELEADVAAAIRVAKPQELGWLELESLTLQALVETRRALDPEREARDELLRRALKDVHLARRAGSHQNPPVADARLAYAEAALLVELSRAEPSAFKDDAERALAAISEAPATRELALLLAQHLEGKRKPGAPSEPGAILPTVVDETADPVPVADFAAPSEETRPIADATPVAPPAATAPDTGEPAATEPAPAEPTSAGGEPDAAEKPPAPARNKLAEADRARRTGKSRSAVRLYEEHLKDSPSSFPALLGLGWSLIDEGQNLRAARAFEQALEVRRNVPEAWLGLAEARRYEGDVAKAIRAYQTFLALKPEGREADLARRQLERLTAGEP